MWPLGPEVQAQGFRQDPKTSVVLPELYYGVADAPFYFHGTLVYIGVPDPPESRGPQKF